MFSQSSIKFSPLSGIPEIWTYTGCIVLMCNSEGDAIDSEQKGFVNRLNGATAHTFTKKVLETDQKV